MSFVNGFRAGMADAGTFNPFGKVAIEQVSQEKKDYDQYWEDNPDAAKSRGLYELNPHIRKMHTDFPKIPATNTEMVDGSQFSQTRLSHSVINVMGSNPFGTGQMVGVVRLVVSAVKFFTALSGAAQAAIARDKKAANEKIEAMGYWAAHFAVGKVETLGLGVVAHYYASGVEVAPKKA